MASPLAPPKADPNGFDAKAIPAMDPRVKSLLVHCNMPYMIPALELEVPDLISDWEMFAKIDEQALRFVFGEICEKLYMEEHLKPEHLDKLCKQLFGGKQDVLVQNESAPPTKASKAAAQADAARREAVKKAEAGTPIELLQQADLLPLREDELLYDRYTWDQTSHEVHVHIKNLPIETKAKDVMMKSLARSLLVAVDEEVAVEGELFALVVSEESEFDLQDAPGRKSRVLTITLLKANDMAAPWPSLFKEPSTG